MGMRENKLPDYESLFEELKDKKNLGLRFIYRLLSQNAKDFIFALIFTFLKQVPVWVIPVVIAQAVNIATDHIAGKPAEISNIWLWALLGLLSLILYVPCHTLCVRFSSRALRKIGAGMRSSMVKKLQHLSITYHREMESGKLQAKFLRDVESIEGLNSQIVHGFIPTCVVALVTTIIVIVKSRVMALAFVIVIPLMIVILRTFRGKIIKDHREFRKEVENVSAKMSDMLDMIPVTKAHGLEEEEIKKLDASVLDLKDKGMQVDKTISYFSSVNWFTHNVLTNLFIILAAVMAYYGLIKVGDILMYNTYFNMVISQINAIIVMTQDIAKGFEGLKSVTDVMVSDDIEDNRGKIKLRYVHGTVEFEGVHYTYPDDVKEVIHGIDLKVEPGECVAFVGASGCGKSTIMNMIIGFLKPTEGIIKIDGKDIEVLNLEDYRKFIAVVPQNSILFTGTIRDNILYGTNNFPEVKLQEILDKANVREFIEKLPNGIDTNIGEHGAKLSGGQKQRISIARALVRDPKIIILDEATSALDNISEYQVQKAMASLIKGRTTFVVAHRLSTIRDANRIVVMKDGEICEIGTYDELMAREGEFYKLKSLSDLTSKGVLSYDM